MYRNAHYLLSVHTVAQLPPDSGREVAFAGRSNSGKSSAINAITGQRGLARTSKTPGRTQQINYFQLIEECFLVDLPGYGFAKVPLAVRQQWQRLIEHYLIKRQSLNGLMLMMDIRHPLTDFDQHILQWCLETEMPVHVLLTKADKLGYSRARQTEVTVQHQLSALSPHISVQLFSALKKSGLSAARAQLDQWLLSPTTEPASQAVSLEESPTSDGEPTQVINYP